MHLGLGAYDRRLVDGLWLPSKAASEIAERLVSMAAGIPRPPAAGAGRSHVMLSGAAILMTILSVWPVERMRIADRGLREGMLYGLLHRRRLAAE